MKIIVNGTPHEVSATTLAGALDELGYGGAVIATAVNGAFTPQTMREQTALNDNDRIEILAPMQGG